MDCSFCELIIASLKVFAIFLLFLLTYNHLTIGKCKSKTRLDGKVVIVTGANSGIGKETARELLRRGARVILACRNLRKALEVASEFRDEVLEANINVKELDLCDFDSIRSFAKAILNEEERIDILINNAGTTGDTFKLTKEGFEEIFQSNFIGPVLLTDLLMPLLRKSSPSRIINTGSIAYLFGKVSKYGFEEQLRSEFDSSGQRYCDSKLALLMWTRALAEEIKSSDSAVTVNVVHPGVVRTSIGTSQLTFMNLIFRIILLIFGRNIKNGAQTLLHLCLDPEGGFQNGCFWAECSPKSTWKGNDSNLNKSLLDSTRQALKQKDL